jgi:hypothetical protein
MTGQRGISGGLAEATLGRRAARPLRARATCDRVRGGVLVLLAFPARHGTRARC